MWQFAGAPTRRARRSADARASGSSCRSRSSRRCPASSATTTACGTGAPSPSRPAGAGRQRLQLHFGAVDWQTHGLGQRHRRSATHSGGYDAFTFDVTAALRTAAPQRVIVGVYDPTDAADGGTSRSASSAATPGGIFYTPTSGIWQTVWLEPVADRPRSAALDADPDLADNTLRVRVVTGGTSAATACSPRRSTAARVVGTATGAPAPSSRVPVPNAHLWSPDDPFLYDLRVTLRNGAAHVDRSAATSACAQIGTSRRSTACCGPLLNGKFVFQVGTLDQGFWPDGLYTAPTDAALAFDLQKHKDAGLQHGAQAHQGRARTAGSTTPTGSACWSGRTCRR